MGELTITLDADQADIVRRAVAGSAEDTAKAIASNLGPLNDGHFRADSARYNRERLAYCVSNLHAELAVLKQLPWSSEEEAEIGLLPEEEATAIKAVIAEKAEAS